MILSLLFEQPSAFFAIVFAFLVSVSIHEFSHALAATSLGDPTARHLGRLTLNPLAHIDPSGFLLVIIIGFGWGRPVPFNPLNLKNQRWGPGLISMAGPLSNIILMLVSIVLLRVLGPSLGVENLLIFFLITMVQLNIILAVFNVIPIPPLDGSKVLFGLLPSRFAHWQITMERLGPMLLFGLIFVDYLVPGVSLFGGLFSAIYSFVLGVAL